VAPYYTCVGAPADLLAAPAERRPQRGEEDARVARWLRVKAVAMEALVRGGGTATHHHAVGRMHRPAFERERGALFGASLAALKRVHDPQWVLNPGVLVEEGWRDGGGGGGGGGGSAKL
jgi:alkyldihydroxyacetonephosphate synthase